MTRIAPGTRTGTSTRAVEYAIGYHHCKACKAETPTPPQDVLDKLTAEGCGASTVWPGEHWTVPGWTELDRYGLLCDACTRAVMEVLGPRAKNAEPPRLQSDQHDLELASALISAALALARDGLMADFPPAVPPPDLRVSWSHVGDPFAQRAYYREHMLRERIRDIQKALIGIPPGSDDE